jgi:hypothetical protein
MAVVALGLVLGGSAPRAVSAPPLGTLSPGGFTRIAQELTINVVFVGYETGAGPRDINAAAFSGVLPSGSSPLHRYPAFYGLQQELGLDFTYDYNVVFAPTSYEDAFFAYLTSIATPAPRTLFQDAYNAEAPRAATIGQNYAIDAPSVEQWLAAHPPAGVDTTTYTVYLVNWYGRADFKFHVYTKLDEPDPDTGYNFGALRSSRKVIAWGGTASSDPQGGPASLARVWFYDLSAGPESWSGNYDITSADVDGDGAADYRMPPVWEYGNANAGLYRPFNDLSRDLGRVARYVAINLLFTSSPLYKPMISPPEVPSSINVDLNIYQADAASNGLNYIKGPMVNSRLNALQPVNSFSTEVRSAQFSSRAASVYLCFVFGPSCYGQRLFGIEFGDLFLYHNDQINQFIEGDADYEVPVFLYNTPDALSAGGLLGFADDNWRDGTQSFVFGFLAPSLRSLGYGFTSTTIHEVGHHLGMSHPHDGYDSARALDYGAAGAFYFTWSGDESNSVMSYIDLNWDFGQFDRDNMNRFLTAGHLNQANAVLALVYASPRAGNGTAALLQADTLAADALNEYAAMRYDVAASRAKAAYRAVLMAADAAGVQVEPQNYTADYKAKGQSAKFIDTVNYQRMAP